MFIKPYEYSFSLWIILDYRGTSFEPIKGNELIFQRIPQKNDSRVHGVSNHKLGSTEFKLGFGIGEIGVDSQQLRL
jgi:hypothetical protein